MRVWASIHYSVEEESPMVMDVGLLNWATDKCQHGRDIGFLVQHDRFSLLYQTETCKAQVKASAGLFYS